jgi:hypothetical protein
VATCRYPSFSHWHLAARFSASLSTVATASLLSWWDWSHVIAQRHLILEPTYASSAASRGRVRTPGPNDLRVSSAGCQWPPILIGRSGADRADSRGAATISKPAMYLLVNLLVNATAQ